MNPQRGGNERRYHQNDEVAGIDDRLRQDDAACNCVDHFTAGKKRPERLEDRSHRKGSAHGDDPRSDRRADIVGDIVRADVHGHVGRDSRGSHDNGRTRFAKGVDGREDGREREENKPEPGRNQSARQKARCLLEIRQPVEILVEDTFWELASAHRRICRSAETVASRFGTFMSAGQGRRSRLAMVRHIDGGS